ncbi:MAG TPA: hypothetical protein VFO51_06375 [Sphingomicrobium sp.]|nr:hypothetical protein [Sphingomicrobium sp.]
MGNKPFTLVAAILFLLMALAHLLRLVLDFQLVVGTHPLPTYASIAGLLIAAVMSWGLFREARR